MKKKRIVKPGGKIEYERLNKKNELITLGADFYLLTAMWNLTDVEAKKKGVLLKSKEKLWKDLKAAHTKDTENLEKLFLAYLLFAVAMELQNSDQITTPKKKIEEVVGTLLKELSDKKDRDDCLQHLKQKVRTCADALSFFESAKKAFDKLRWNHSYGGKKWKKIADAAIMRLNGEINAVVFVDVVFDIEHHAGHVFDKHNEIDCDSEKLTALLDVKRDSSLEKMYKKFTRECKYASFRIKSFYARGVVAEWWEEIKNGTS